MAEGYSMKRRAVSRLENIKSKILPLIIYIIIIQIANIHLNSKLLLAFGLKNFTDNDHLLLTGDPALIGVACSIVSDITGGKYKLLKWDRQEKTYYPIEVNIFQK